jgi:general secretion pathway protein A
MAGPRKEVHCFGSWASESELLEYYQLREEPFADTPDPRYLYLSSTHRRALGSLVYGIEAARGFLALTGEPGVGKTTLLFLLLKRLKQSARTAFVFQTLCDPREFLLYLLADLGIGAAGQDLASMQQQLRDVVAEEARAGRRVVLIIDEAQHLESPAFEFMQQLSDPEGTKAGSLQVLFSGHPRLADKLARPALTRFKEQVRILAQLDRLDAGESDRYIDHRLRMAGYSGSQLFTSDAREVIARCSEGIPRKINNICFNALIRGYARKQESIDSALVRDALAGLELGQSVAETGSPPINLGISLPRHRVSIMQGLMH